MQVCRCSAAPSGRPHSCTVRALTRQFMVVVVVLATGLVCFAQQPSGADTDKQTIQMLIQRVTQLEHRVAQLEAERAAGLSNSPGNTATAPVQQMTIASVSATPSDPPQQDGPGKAAHPQTTGQTQPENEQQVESSERERMDLSKTLLRIRGFGDITFHGDNYPGDRTSFSLGQLNLFVTSDISENFKFLSEIVFEAGGAEQQTPPLPNTQPNIFSVDIERYLLQYSPNDYFNLAIGRYHTAIGYYNTAYHHSTWLQTATGRPFLFEFEDDGGILPIHNIGLSASGLIPSGSLGLHYVAEVGNGRAWGPPSVEPVQNEFAQHNFKAFNLALFARPEAIRGLQIGFSGYHDHLTPVGSPNMNETIVAGHFVLVRPKFEWLNEAMVVRHTPDGTSHTFETPGFYTQVSKQFGSYRPYFRYQYVNAPADEPLFSYVGLRHGPSAGVRYDASESVAFKLQYDYTALRRTRAVNGLSMQVGFTF